MSQLAAAIDADDELLTVDTLPPSPYVQIDDELIEIRARFPGGIYPPTQEDMAPKIRVRRGQAGTTKASHAEAATLTPVYGFGAGGGGGGVTLDNTVDPPAEVTTIIAPGADLVGDAVTLGAWELIANGDDSVSLNRDVEAPGDGDAFAKTIVDAGGTGTASAQTDVNNTGSGDANATSSATANTGHAENGVLAHTTGGAGGASVVVDATDDSAGGSATARLSSQATDAAPATTFVEALTIDADAIVQLTANSDDGAVSTTLVLTAPTGGVASLVITGLPTADPGVGNKLWNDAGTLKITAAA